MNNTNDGGPAFPFDWMDFQPNTGIQVVRGQFQGMTIRDYFAAKALQSFMDAMLRSPQLEKDTKDIAAARYAAAAYHMADAMLAERIK